MKKLLNLSLNLSSFIQNKKIKIKLSIYFLTILQCSIFQLHAQEFQTTIFAESNGNLDSIIVGFDITSSIDIDDQFGEVDINNTVFDATFEIRAGQIDLNELQCDDNLIDSNSDLITYMSKIDIVPMDCDGYDFNQTINGLPPYSSFFVRNKDLPVTIKWDSAVFDNDCMNKSFITELHPGGWFDVTCGGESIYLVEMVNQDSLEISNPSAAFLIDSFGDTLSMYHIAIRDEIITSNVSERLAQDIEIYPNPTNDFLNIISDKQEINLVEIYNSRGKLMNRNTNAARIDLNSFPSGIYILRIKVNGIFLTKKVTKFT